MRKKFVLPENSLNKDQIFNLIWDSDNNDTNDVSDFGDLSRYAMMNFGDRIMDEGFHRYENYEVQDWYYREYLPDRASDIENGYYRGQ